jgi:hypothetical protein
MTTDDLATAFRAYAAGLYPLEAGITLLISNETFLRHDFTDRAQSCPGRSPSSLRGSSRTVLPTVPLTSATCAHS